MSLADYPLQFEDVPFHKPERVGRTLQKMSKQNNTSAPEVKASKAKYNKTRGEHFKDILIAVLVAGIIAFIGGMQFQSHQQKAIETAMKSVTPTASAQAPAEAKK